MSHTLSDPPSPLAMWRIRGRALLPIVQGGMGVGISAHKLAGTVAHLGALGTISSVDLRHHHPDLLEQAKGCTDRVELDRINLIALDLGFFIIYGISQIYGADQKKNIRE